MVNETQALNWAFWVRILNGESNMNKQELIELWKDAPEGATHYHKPSITFYKWIGSALKFWDVGRWNVSACNASKLTPELTPRPEPLIYTKEQYDAGELPKVGMRVLVKLTCTDFLNISEVECDGAAVDVIFIDNGLAIFRFDRRYIGLNDQQFQPIDTRTDTQKAIEDLTGEDNCYMNIEEARGLFSVIKAGKIHGVTFSGKD